MAYRFVKKTSASIRVNLPALLNYANEERSLSRGIAPQEHPKRFSWGAFNRGGQFIFYIHPTPLSQRLNNGKTRTGNVYNRFHISLTCLSAKWTTF
jgi:hypothetical protein